MKIVIILVIILGLLIISPVGLLLTWIVSSPFVTNFIARPYENPFFGSSRLVDRFAGVPGFDVRELFNYDRIVLILLLLIILNRSNNQRTKFGKIDIPFIMLLGAIFLSTLYSHNFVHRCKVAVDTFGLCYIAYFLGKNFLFEDQQFNKYLNAILVLGCILIIVSLSEQFIHRDIFLYRITGPFLYWENLGLTLTLIFFITVFKKMTNESENQLVNKFYNLLLILLCICIFLTQTRTIMAVVLIGLFFMSIKGRDVISRRAVKKYVSLGILLIVIIMVNPMLLKNTGFYKHRLSKRTDEARLENYLVALKIFQKNPILGIGLKDYQEDKLKYMTSQELENAVWIGQRSTCHNSYLVVAAEIGLVGLIPMIFLVIFSYKICQQYYCIAEDRTEKLWALIMGALTVSYFLSAILFDPFFEPTIDNKLFYMCLGISVGRYKKLEDNL